MASSDAFALVDASAFARLGSPRLGDRRAAELAHRIDRGLIAASTALLLETRSGRRLPPVDAGDLPLLWIRERAERRASELQLQMRAAHQQLGIPPLDYLTVAIAEDHGASLIHYDADFERIGTYTDLSIALEPLAPLGELD